MSAGLLEALLVSVPAETLKTRRLASGLSYSALMQHGLRGVYAGVLPTILRQGLHGAVRFGSYSSMKNFVQGSTRPGQALPGGITFALGAVAGLITVCATQPLDVVKTRMQERTPGAAPLPGVWSLARHIMRTEGTRALWRGATPRLCRLIVGGGVTFLCYEEVVYLANGGM
ncbi:mitochondrial carrier [Tilletiopsis washingtonensis]|uniref:Mitochondrial carrier n=1 Tax=Tilletiopsis washingtonensis TaxID=58919 RepID=A0A316YZL7_9BASI|nr:mitochondrial carrier [Tilletiopsis washingtonensis]PWN94592.1 mitochondrial carrier [Tilletiopsis washingtonensis]